MMEVRIPARYSEITLERFVAWHNGRTDAERLMNITGLPFGEVQKIAPKYIKELCDRIREVLSLHTQVHAWKIKDGRTELGFIPDMTEISMAEHVDLSATASDVWRKDGSVNYAGLIDLMMILYRPITDKVGDRYRIADYDSTRTEHRDTILKLSMDKVNGALLFFSTIRRQLLEDSLRYSEMMMWKAMMDAMEELNLSLTGYPTGGIGTTPSNS